ncbi:MULTISPECIES: phage tail assembly chaperone [Rhizobium]|uniref:phage tail assembly chaperone n=1 Tax=Rhizobium TaxID=379 RepID=UPI001A91684B|nr:MULTISPECIES: phage tail assembly chaperone [Rhizobium]MBX5017502.1 phage tail assembly chaperone [Rhizobium lentis]MBX5063443.1 phage tail assembly chaperone [Rhizobium lentis]MBX5075549.1 phage tail assembly chaperone [Rhizobium lentis]MBX5213026.1 phage tail assembly chaperone [Rhizobium sp. NLR9a]MBX5256018.1 phage tail assembly chaperone [Rhizobium sp. NLR16b]
MDDTPFPWRQWMRIGIGGLKWRPADFWDATLTEFFDGIEGHNEAQGVDEQNTDAPSDRELEALVAKYG